jgi:hypothetical protein
MGSARESASKADQEPILQNGCGRHGNASSVRSSGVHRTVEITAPPTGARLSRPARPRGGVQSESAILQNGFLVRRACSGRRHRIIFTHDNAMLRVNPGRIRATTRAPARATARQRA